jgi:sulfoxide reductase heme-binding subunit YedZ
VFWITSRAAGFSALILASLAVSLGLVMSLKVLKGRGPDLLVVHEILSLSTIAAILVHGVSLLGDHYMHPSLADISIPFVSGYKTIWTSIGIVSGWTLIVLGLSYYARRRIGSARWRKLHRFTAVAWLVGILHALGEGTDAGQLWFLAMVGIVALPALALLLWRWWAPPRGATRAPRPRATATGASRPLATATGASRPLATATGAPRPPATATGASSPLAGAARSPRQPVRPPRSLWVER